ncbi:MAG: penicillin-binding protein 1C [Proteobacteria bacterium]|nr:penicillin-binding protein 1C [Pseudomonadota bacterium]
MTTRRWCTRLWRWATVAITAGNLALLVVLALVVLVPLPARDARWSTVITYRDGTPAHVFLASDDKWRLPVTLDGVDPRFVDALVALEDKRFWSHDGVDTIAIARAAWTDVTRGRRVSGGSTLSMQLARLLEPRPRTIPSKLADMFRAVQLDLRLSKREILAAYLARTPYGGNVEGVESAAWAYFGHGAKHLAPVEIATLLAVPQGPARYAPSEANVARLRARRDAILDKLVAAGVFVGADVVAARQAIGGDGTIGTPVPERLIPLPRAAPHAALALRARFPDRATIQSTLDAGLQALVEKQVALQRPELVRKGIHNGAVVVVDHHTREVVALAGNLDFTDTKHGGQIAMFDRPRSPGSTLKPLLYALAIDRGAALPGYLVADIPTQYGTYRPKNFDGEFAGLVTLRESLGRSLNIPFIDLLDRLGVGAFVKELARLDVRAALATTPDQFGLSIVVGGIELSPLELAGIYATLAEDGTYRPLRLAVADVPGSDAHIFGPGAAYLTRDALAQKDRPDFPARRSITAMPTGIHWKTGTSFGFHDAWAAGSGPTYTAVVWTGNADNTPTADLVGSSAAGPLLFDVLEGVAGRTVPPTSSPPADLVEVEVCTYSGYLAGDSCTHRTRALAEVHAVPTVRCPYHQAFEVDRASGRAILPACRVADHVYDRQNFVVLPSALATWLVERDRAIPDAPVFDEACAEAGALATAPIIRAPVDGQVVTLIPGVPATHQRVPFAASTHAAKISWFVDGALVATLPAAQRFAWVPTVGDHEIVVADEAGRKARRALVVR